MCGRGASPLWFRARVRCAVPTIRFAWKIGCMLHRFFFWTGWLTVLMAMWGCATPPPVSPTGAMVVVRLLTRQEPPDSLVLQVTREGQAEPMAAVNGLLYSRIGGRSADYLVAIPLPAGRYVVAPEGGSAASMAAFQLAIEVPAGPPVYVGRLLVPQDRSRAPALEERFADDMPMFRDAIASLRMADIHLRMGTLRQERPADAAAGSSMEVVPVSEALAVHLPPAARAGFARYMKLRSPRAFAVSEDGVFSMASGSRGVVERAMQECAKLSPKRPCRLFAVDQTATLWRACGAAGSAPAGGPAPGEPGRSLASPRVWLRLADVAPGDSVARSTGTGCPATP